MVSGDADFSNSVAALKKSIKDDEEKNAALAEDFERKKDEVLQELGEKLAKCSLLAASSEEQNYATHIDAAKATLVDFGRSFEGASLQG